MPDRRYDAARQTLGTLLSTTSPSIEVPPWQRSYSWGSDEIEAFWQDLIRFDQAYPADNIVSEEYFLGSTVLVTGGEKNLILDGQQRLATATILLSVLRDERRGYKSDAATRLQNKYIADFNDASNTSTPVLTLNVYDRLFFRREVQDEPIGDWSRPVPQLRSHTLIRKARTYFLDRVQAESKLAGGGDAAFSRNLRLGSILCDHMSVVVVSSTDENNAASVFETLNDRGIGLSTPDLLRNYLLRRATTDDHKEQIVAAWQVVLGLADEASVDDFLRHFWVSHYGDVKSRKLYREIKATMENEKIDPLKFSLDLSDAAGSYRDIVKAQDPDASVVKSLQAIRELGAKTLYPAVLSGYAARVEGAAGDVELSQFVAALVTTFVRYNVIGARENSVLESAIYAAAASLRSDKSFSQAIASLREVAPEGEEFVRRFARASIARVATSRYLLREIEYAKRRTAELEVSAANAVRLEHIYPQTPSEGRWENHLLVINRLGNLTLLGRRLNISIKNSAFDKKKVNGYSSSDIMLTKELLEYSDWNADSVSRRQEELSRWAFQIWKFPGEELPAGAIVFNDESDGLPYAEDLPETP